MHRLFVAIRPPEPIRAQLLDLMEGISEARWQDEDQLHLTLRFIGEVDARMAEDIDAALTSVRHPPFELALGGLGAFDRRGHPTALWAGVAPHEPLKALHKKVDHALQQAGLAPERRAYLPHITLARFGRGGGSLQPLLARAGTIASAPFPVREFRLYESRLTPAGAIYTPVAHYSLG
ncbi:MAG TPA: RNA 2',3'-cyclic phosphodiesterase [Allosphingosinicella sp.]|jgi:2'-5' RNA ligase